MRGRQPASIAALGRLSRLSFTPEFQRYLEENHAEIRRKRSNGSVLEP
jgi:hypothetical protein